MPSSVEEVVDILKLARESNRTCRVVGAGHSWFPLGLTDGFLVNLDKMNSVLSIDKIKMTVTVEAGIRIGKLSKTLDQIGLSLINTGVINRQSIAGATATGTHGSGTKFKILSDAIQGVEMVLANGTVVWISEQHGMLFQAARISLGVLGVVTKLNLRVIPKFSVWKRNPLSTITTVINTLDILANRHDHVLVWWVPYQETVQMLEVNRTEFLGESGGECLSGSVCTNTDEKSTLAQKFAVLKMQLLGAITYLSSKFPSLFTPFMNRFMLAPLFNFWTIQDPFFVKVGYEGLLSGHPDSYDEMEYFFPSENFHELWTEFFHFLEDNKFWLGANHVVQLRWTACDRILLSPFYRKDCDEGSRYFVAMAILSRGFSRQGYFDLAEKIFLRHGGRPHWGKMHFLNKFQLTEIYGENFLTFSKIREELDPAGLFLNPALRNFLL
eukprot:TRINITY_DN101_c0_g2_i9.p1 TRINITY_DN101_c0_g2~~TRINITY_DN101_c0_g2_i9.p1  ORF type:complete len:440 (+),score=67.37 TRINITY_DN101_c0_g2_i9:296-1615(+)